MDRKVLSTGAILGMIAIILGAFGAHALKKILSIEQLATFETGVRYQMYHALFLLFIGLIKNMPQKAKKAVYFFGAFWCNFILWINLPASNKQPHSF